MKYLPPRQIDCRIIESRYENRNLLWLIHSKHNRFEQSYSVYLQCVSFLVNSFKDCDIKLQKPWLIFQWCLLIFHEFQKRKRFYFKSLSTRKTFSTLFWSMMAEEHVVLLADEFVKIILTILNPISTTEDRHAAILVIWFMFIVCSLRTQDYKQ